MGRARWAELSLAQGMAIELDSHDVVVKRAAIQRWLGALITLGAIACGVFALSQGSLLGWTAGLFGLAIGPMVFASAGRDPNTRSGREAALRIEGDALVIDGGRHRIAKTEVEGGWIEEDFVGGTLVIETRGGLTVAARFLDEHRDRADALLEALGVDARVVVMRIAASERASRGCAGGCFAFALLVGLFPLMAFVAALVEAVGGHASALALFATGVPTVVALVSALLSYRALSSTTLHIGADGVRIGRRFIPYAELREMRYATGGVIFDTARGPRKVRCLAVQATAIIRKIERAMARFHRGEGAADLSVLDRMDRSFDEWRQGLARVFDPTTYRRRTLERSELVTVVEDPQAPPERRVAAIFALHEGASDDERRRCRIATESCAEPNTRAALEAALEEELAEVERALARAPSRRRSHS